MTHAVPQPFDIVGMCQMIANMVCEQMRNEGNTVQEETIRIDRTQLISGWAQIGKEIGVSDRYAKTLHQKGIFSEDAIWQETKRGKVYADPEVLVKEWKKYCINK